MKENICTIRCDRCKVAIAEIMVEWLQPWEEINEELRSLGWLVDDGDVCPDCAKKGSNQ